MRRIIRRPSAAMVVACLALLVALSGTSIAAIAQIPRASVGTPQLKRNAVTAAKINPNSVRTGHVLNGSLLTEDFKAGQIPQGPTGAAGPAGPAGPAGATNVRVRTASVSIPAGTVGAVIAVCDANERATGGGALLGGHFNAAPATILRSYPTIGNSEGAPSAGQTPTSWTTRLLNPLGGAATASGFVVCAAP